MKWYLKSLIFSWVMSSFTIVLNYCFFSDHAYSEILGTSEDSKEEATIPISKITWQLDGSRDRFLRSESEFVLPIGNKAQPIVDLEKLRYFSQSATTDSPELIKTPPLEPYKPLNRQRVPLKVWRFYQTSPVITIIIPSAYGASWGDIGVGMSFQERTRFTNKADGTVGIGVGFGQPRENVGVEVGLIITDLKDDTFQDGRLNLKIHRQLPADFNIALGVQGVSKFGDTDGGSSVYGVVTKRFSIKESISEPFSEIYVTVGVGGGQFRTESAIANEVNSVGVFGSVAVRVIEPINFISEWTGQDLTMGVAIVPFQNLGLVIIPAITDITGTAGDGARFVFGVGYRFSF
jgi:hypothetical protein